MSNNRTFYYYYRHAVAASPQVDPIEARYWRMRDFATFVVVDVAPCVTSRKYFMRYLAIFCFHRR